MDFSEPTRSPRSRKQQWGTAALGGGDLEEVSFETSVASGTHAFQSSVLVLETAEGGREIGPCSGLQAYERTSLTAGPSESDKSAIALSGQSTTAVSDKGIVWTLVLSTPVSVDTGVTSASAEGKAAVTTLIRRIYSLPNASAVADRLEALHLTEAELEGDEPLNAGSLLYFAEFLERESRVKAPIITLTPEGNIYASWRHGRSLLSIQFMPDGRISYVSFAPNPGRPTLIDRRHVQTTADQLSSELSALSVRTWLHR